jgi:hypothetical protein
MALVILVTRIGIRRANEAKIRTTGSAVPKTCMESGAPDLVGSGKGCGVGRPLVEGSVRTGDGSGPVGIGIHP